MDPAIVAEIRQRLTDITVSHTVTIPLAIESGSRAWGFPSPDSDYDCRFIFVRSRAATFTLFPSRDVIETPLTKVFDVSGWELSKALRLMLKGNAVVVEWLTSPFAYCRDEAFREAFLALAERACDRRLIGRHYYHLAANQLDRLQVDQITIPLKKLFYSLRPLMALKWLDENPQASVAPMHFPSLCAGVELSASVRQDIDELMARKAETREMGSGPIPPSIRAFLNAEFDAAKSWRDSEVAERPEIQPDIDAFWREWTDRLALA